MSRKNLDQVQIDLLGYSFKVGKKPLRVLFTNQDDSKMNGVFTLGRTGKLRRVRKSK